MPLVTGCDSPPKGVALVVLHAALEQEQEQGRVAQQQQQQQQQQEGGQG